MSVVLVCPKCGDTATVERLPVEACPRCGTPYPTQARLAAESALKLRLAAKPGLIVLGQMLSAMFGGILLGLVALAAAGTGDLTLFGEQVTGREFLVRAGPLLGGVGLVLGAIAYGLSRDARWTRPLMLVMWSLPIVEGATRLATGTLEHPWNIAAFIVSLAAMPLAAVYLYRRDNVVSYYDARTPGREPTG
ncbi:MAG: hypothetical protein HYX65_10620 [Gemmatimonadetes bacterium]|nr:hypothetical protein [Gemmatimonadota bacterium]